MGLFFYEAARRAVDHTGAPIKNAERRIYEMGSVSLAKSYVDPDLTNPQASDQRSDANGDFPLCYLTDGAYRVEVLAPDGEMLHQAEAILVGDPLQSGRSIAFKTPADLAADELLSYQPTTGRLTVWPGAELEISSTSVRYRILPETETTAVHLTNQTGVKFREIGNRFTSEERFIETLAAGASYAQNDIVDAGSKTFMFLDDGNTFLAGLTGWVSVPKEQVSLQFGSMEDMLADERLSYTAGPSLVQVSVGDVITLRAASYSFQVLESSSSSPNLTTAGGLKLRVRGEHKERYSATAFGVGLDGNSVTDDTVALQAAIDFVSARQGELLIDQTVRYNSPLLLTHNIRIIASQTGFTTRLIPQDCPAFVVDGANASGGWAFEVKLDDILIDLSEITTPQPYAALFKNCYRTHMRRVRFHHAAMNSATGLASVIKTEETCNHLIFEDVVAYGLGNTGSGRIFELRHTAGHLTLFNPDVENAYNGFLFGRNVSVDVYSPYTERLGTAFWFLSSSDASLSHFVNIYGGHAKVPSSTSRVFRFDGGVYDKGEKININGLTWESADHAAVNTMISTGSFEWRNTSPLVFANLDWSWVTPPPSAVLAAAQFLPVDPYDSFAKSTRRIDLSDLAPATPTDVFTLSNLQSTGDMMAVTVKVRAFTARNGVATALDEALWVLQKSGSAPLFVSAKQTIAAQMGSNDPDYDITAFAVETSSDTDSVTFAINSSFSTVGSTTLDTVWFDIETTGQVQFSKA